MAIAFVLVQAEAGREKEVYDGLLKISEIHELVPLFGEYDLIGKVEAADLDAIGSVIVNQIRMTPGVTSTKTLAGTKF